VDGEKVLTKAREYDTLDSSKFFSPVSRRVDLCWREEATPPAIGLGHEPNQSYLSVEATLGCRPNFRRPTTGPGQTESTTRYAVPNIGPTPILWGRW
jgi:hypothetical protein